MNGEQMTFDDILRVDGPHPPAQQHSRTSVEAAEAIEPRAETLRREVLECLRRAGRDGLTDEEIQNTLGMAGNTERPRRTELCTARLVADSGRTRKTASNRNAVVWVAIEFKEKA